MGASSILTHDREGFFEKLAKDLVRIRPGGRGAVITTPVLFPSGSHVTVLVSLNGDRCLITDDGAAFGEADLMGAANIFRRAAKKTAEEAGVKFNSYEIFEAEAKPERAAGMIAIIADAARRSVQLTSERLAKKIEVDTRETMLDQLREIFGAPKVIPEAVMPGASSHSWKLDALVESDDGLIALEALTPAANSVSSAYIKLDDIRRLDGGPRTAAVLSNKKSFTSDQLVMLGRTATLIDLKSGRSAFARLAA